VARSIYMGRQKTLEEKLWPKIRKGDPDDCWPWTGYVKSARKGNAPYGRINVRVGPRSENKHVDLLAHRVAYELSKGSIPDDLLVRHTCHNTLCCNPAHLVVGTVQDNSDDMVKAGRSLSGERNPKAKLRERDVQEIRRLRRKGFTLGRIAEQFDVGLRTALSGVRVPPGVPIEPDPTPS
jgi:hypothetical protein